MYSHDYVHCLSLQIKFVSGKSIKTSFFPPGVSQTTASLPTFFGEFFQGLLLYISFDHLFPYLGDRGHDRIKVSACSVFSFVFNVVMRIQRKGEEDISVH